MIQCSGKLPLKDNSILLTLCSLGGRALPRILRTMLFLLPVKTGGRPSAGLGGRADPDCNSPKRRSRFPRALWSSPLNAKVGCHGASGCPRLVLIKVLNIREGNSCNLCSEPCALRTAGALNAGSRPFESQTLPPRSLSSVFLRCCFSLFDRASNTSHPSARA